ncbi:MAG: hypothetical protein QMD17_00955 [Rhodocyclaceae bacterium]|nr:hypothetical protein [Rhodocyclaceae bacterium]
MHSNLSFEQAPPLSVPYRFFLTAPWFGVAAGLLLAFMGEDMLASRWTPAALAGTHLLVAGFMLQAMCGALLQFVPVATGGNIWQPGWVAAWVHPLLIIAVGLLVAAFLTQYPVLFMAASLGFAVALGFYAVVVGVALWRTPAQSATIVALRIALIGLVVTLGLGVTLSLGLAYQTDLPLLALTDVHAAWGLGGWALMLLAGVAYFVVPMFQLTPAYPGWLARGVPLLLLALLLVWSLLPFGYPDGVRQFVLLSGLGTAGLFAGMTLYLQGRRRRKVSDTNLLFFRTAMLSLVALLFSALLFVALPDLGNDPRAPVWLGMLAVVGVFVTSINGMLYKIVPFLNWLHLQRLCGLNSLPPTMNQMIPERIMRRQFYLHLTALACLLVAVWLPILARPAGLIFALACAWLGVNLVSALRVYLRFRNRIRAAA